MRAFFEIGEIPAADRVLAVLVGLCPVTAIEILKLARRAVQRG